MSKSRLKEFLSDIHEPLVIHYRVNAGYIPPDHWVQDPEQGGGRIIGEVCHFVDFLTFLAGSLSKRVHARALANNGRYQTDNLTATIEFVNGSLGTITYVAGGDKAFSKERVEVFGGGTVAVLDNFRKLELWRNGQRKVVRSILAQDKGHCQEWTAFANNIKSGQQAKTGFDEIIQVANSTFSIASALRLGEPVPVTYHNPTANK